MDLVDPVIESLERSPEIVIPLVWEVPKEVLRRRPKPHKWSAHEHACHLAHVHSLMSERLERMLTEPQPRIKSYLPDADEEDGALLEVDLMEAMNRFAADRQQLVKKLRALSPEDWQQTAEHDEYTHYSVFIMFRHLAMHDLLHAYRIEELLLKKDWE